MPRRENFCCVGDFPLLIPYKELQKLLEVARNLGRYERNLAHVNKQLTALRQQYADLTEKVQELERIM